MNFDLMTVLNILVLVGAAASCVIATFAPRVLDAVLALAAAGSFMAVEFLFLQAPDVAIAEAAVGAVLGTVLYIIALHRVRSKAKEEPKK